MIDKFFTMWVFPGNTSTVWFMVRYYPNYIAYFKCWDFFHRSFTGALISFHYMIVIPYRIFKSLLNPITLLGIKKKRKSIILKLLSVL